MTPIRLVNLADIDAKAQAYNSNKQAMQMNDLKMRAAQEENMRARSLRDLVASSYGNNGMDYDKLEQGATRLGDLAMAKQAGDMRDGRTKAISEQHKRKIEIAQQFVDAGDSMGLEQFVRSDDETPDDVKVAINKDGSMSMQSSAWPQPRTIKPSLNAQKMAGGGVDPYSTVLNTNKGAFSYDVRTKALEPLIYDNERLSIANSDPTLQGNISRAKSFGNVAGETEGITTVKKPQQGKDTLSLLNGVDPLLADATGSLLGAGRDAVAGAFGQATKGSAAGAKLKVIQAGLMANMPRMEGPQSDMDVKLYREAAGQIGDPTVPADIKKSAVETIRQINQKYVAQGQSGQGVPEGTTRRSKRTGEVQIFQGGQWQRQ